jgi:hypothetical protein
MVIRQSLRASRNIIAGYAVPPVGTRVRARQYLYDNSGRPVSVYFYDPPPLPSLTEGIEILVSFRPLDRDNENLFYTQPLAVDPSRNTLTVPWMQFPVGTPASQILDPSEWNDPMLGCDPVCRENSGRDYPPPYTDGAPDAYLLDAVTRDAPTRG